MEPDRRLRAFRSSPAGPTIVESSPGGGLRGEAIRASAPTAPIERRTDHDDTRGHGPMSTPQAVDAPLTRAAVFLTATVREGREAEEAVRSALGALPGLVRAVGFREPDERLSCVVGIGSDVWDRLTGLPHPALLHPLAPVHGSVHTAPATPGDLLFHLRADRGDLCFELERLLMERLGGHVDVVDETVGFRSFDSRDLLGFVDGTENPTGTDALASTVVADGPDAGGSYLVGQRYLHDLVAWESIPLEVQQHIIGRSKIDDVELEPPAGERPSHRALATIVDDSGVEHDIVRDNMPFGRPGHGEFGTYFLGYSRDPGVIEQMLHRMFVGEPAGSYDRMLDVSRATTGALFFAPPAELLESLAP